MGGIHGRPRVAMLSPPLYVGNLGLHTRMASLVGAGSIDWWSCVYPYVRVHLSRVARIPHLPISLPVYPTYTHASAGNS